MKTKATIYYQDNFIFEKRESRTKILKRTQFSEEVEENFGGSWGSWKKKYLVLLVTFYHGLMQILMWVGGFRIYFWRNSVAVVVPFIRSFPSTLHGSVFQIIINLIFFSYLSSEHGNVHWALTRKTHFALSLVIY